MIEIERLIFVCPDLEEACSDSNWKKFCISPIRQTRPFMKSRYVLFKNIMLELLQVIEDQDCEDFVFFEEWKQSHQPTWISTGCKVNNLEDALRECKKFNIDLIENFIRTDEEYKKGFKYRSCLLSKKWCEKHVYLTEYDDLFLDHRLKQICKEPLKKDSFDVKIPNLSLEDLANQTSHSIEEQGRVRLNIFQNTPDGKIASHDFGWMALDIGIQFGMYSLRKAKRSDVDGMAYVHAISWQETYSGFLDDQIISKFNLENRKKMWSGFLEKKTAAHEAYVADHSDRIVGIASWHETPDHIELLALYVLAEFQHNGIGRALFKQVEKNATEKDKPLITWVLKGNKAASFYEKMGLKFIKSEEKYLGGTLVHELMFSNQCESL
jgi:GNAT superfamily N-acetyltransferase